MKDVVDLTGLRAICKNNDIKSVSLLLKSLYNDPENGVLKKDDARGFDFLFAEGGVSSLHIRGRNREGRSIIIFYEIGFGAFDLCGGGMIILPPGTLNQNILRSALIGRPARNLIDHPTLADPVTISSIEAGGKTQTVVYLENSEIEIAKAIQQLEAGKIP